MTGYAHVPVLLPEVLEALAPQDGELFVDCTLGGGGHAVGLLRAAACTVIGIDRDPAALTAARLYAGADADRLRTVRGGFEELDRHLDALGVDRVDGVLADLGVSSHQLDTPDRGFSFRRPGPVDMRMDPDAPQSAADLVNHLDARELERIIRSYGEERAARRVARAIVEGRPWTDTQALGSAVARAVGRSSGRIHPATRTFQALRIAVNEELDALEQLLPAAEARLRAGGRLALITFHSLEDRIAKRFLARRAGKGLPRDPWGNPVGEITLRLHPPRTAASDDPNPRARSARLRAASRLPWNE